MNDQLVPDRNSNGSRPRLVTDHDGRGWQAAAHGGLTWSERQGLVPERVEAFDDADTVRLTRRGYNMDQVARFTIEGARDLAKQLLNAALEAENTRNAVYARNALDAEAERAMQEGDGSPPWEQARPSDAGRVYHVTEEDISRLCVERLKQNLHDQTKHKVSFGKVLADEDVDEDVDEDNTVGGKLNPMTVPPPEQQPADSNVTTDLRLRKPTREYSEQPLKTDEIATAIRMGVRVRDIQTSEDPANAAVRAQIADFTSQQLDDVVAKADDPRLADPRPTPSIPDREPVPELGFYSDAPLTEAEKSAAKRLMIPIGRSNRAQPSVHNARIRRDIAFTTWDERQA